jgi:hypothetical protein
VSRQLRHLHAAIRAWLAARDLLRQRGVRPPVPEQRPRRWDG